MNKKKIDGGTDFELEYLEEKMKETWDKLTESDMNLYNTKREEFFSKLKEYHGLSKKDAEKKIKELEKTCGYTPANN